MTGGRADRRAVGQLQDTEATHGDLSDRPPVRPSPYFFPPYLSSARFTIRSIARG
jgi:hypothetical protein